MSRFSKGGSAERSALGDQPGVSSQRRWSGMGWPAFRQLVIARQIFSNVERTHPTETDGRVHFFSSCGQLRITVTGVSDESETGWFTRKRLPSAVTSKLEASLVRNNS